MTNRLFLFGTLLDPDLFEIVAGVPFTATPAVLPDARVCLVESEAFPILASAPGQLAAGAVVSVDDTVRDRLNFYELGFGYEAVMRQVVVEGQPVDALVYVPSDDWAVDGDWSLADWQAAHGALSRLAAREYMALMPTHTAAEAARAFPQIRMRAASRLRAEETPSPALQPDLSDRMTALQATRRPYTDYFSVREDWVSFPTFDGQMSPVVKRASFLSGDAVTVLPYDPRLDAVLAVRQFRHGALVRGDPNPWTLEPAAGRIDPGEAPEETARRELLEETGLEARDLHFAGRYYPSPGAYSEFLYSYVATADLSGRDKGVSGLDDEAEDIMAHVIPFDEAMAMIETGAANTGPLIISLRWIAMHRHEMAGDDF